MELALGFEGLALLRSLFEDDPSTPEARLADIARFVQDADEPPLSLALDLPERSVTEGYAEWAETYDAMPNGLIEVEQRVIGDLLADIPPGRALDAACGTGRLARLLVAAGHDTTGADCTPEMLDVARRALPDATFRLAQLDDLPFDDESFDVVTCGLALGHLPTLDAVVPELARVTRIGGRLLFSDMHPMGIVFGGQASYQGSGGTWGFVRNHFHLHSHYLDAFAPAGLRVRGCIEAPQTEDTVKGVPAFLVSPEATRQALLGLPLALVWDLERTG